MIKSYNFQILFRILLIVIFSVASGISFYSEKHLLLGVISTGITIIFIAALIKYIHAVDDQVNFFFESMLNDDFSSVYALKRKSKILDQLNKNLERVNRKMQLAIMDNARQEHYFRALIEHIGTGVLSCNSDGFVIHANSSFKQLVGINQLTHVKQLQKVDHSLMTSILEIRHKEQKMLSFETDKKKGKTKILLKAITFTNGEEKLKLISAQDINKELNENELDSWMKLIRVLTHEIMNSIAPITSLSETLSGLYFQDGKVIDISNINKKTIETTIRGLDVIQEQGKGLMHFVESYRTLMRLPEPKKEKIQLLSYLENNIIITQNKDITISISSLPEERDLCINGDKEQLYQVITNLIKNGIYALEDVENPLLQIWYGKNDQGQVEISITDNGHGIEPKLLEEIFIPFFTTKESGSGIGLSLSRQIMRLHGGWLKVQSEIGKGTVFTMIFQ